MATQYPDATCMICGAHLEFDAVDTNPKLLGLYGPTTWKQRPHRCPPEEIEKWKRTVDQPRYNPKGSESAPPKDTR